MLLFDNLKPYFEINYKLCFDLILLIFFNINKYFITISRNTYKEHIFKYWCTQAKAALASSWLIGVGFQSAMEVYDTVTTYLGDDIRADNPQIIGEEQDFGHISNSFQPTEYFVKLFNEFTTINIKKKKFLK